MPAGQVGVDAGFERAFVVLDGHADGECGDGVQGNARLPAAGGVTRLSTGLRHNPPAAGWVVRVHI